MKMYAKMDDNKKEKLPTDIIIASFRGDLTNLQKTELSDWLSQEGNQAKYDALKRVWDSTVSNAGEIKSQKAYCRLRRKISNVWKKFAAAATVAAVAAIGFTLYNIYDTRTESVLTQTYTCVTGKSSVALPDGSTVVLHNGATLSYDNSFSKTNRVGMLEGEAYFDVAKDTENTLFWDPNIECIWRVSFIVLGVDIPTTKPLPVSESVNIDVGVAYGNS